MSVTVYDTFLPTSHNFTRRIGQVSHLRTENDTKIQGITNLSDKKTIIIHYTTESLVATDLMNEVVQSEIT